MLNLNLIHDFLVKTRAIEYAGVPDTTTLNNFQIEIILEWPNNLLRMCNTDLQMLCEIAESFLKKSSEEKELV